MLPVRLVAGGRCTAGTQSNRKHGRQHATAVPGSTVREVFGVVISWHGNAALQ